MQGDFVSSFKMPICEMHSKCIQRDMIAYMYINAWCILMHGACAYATHIIIQCTHILYMHTSSHTLTCTHTHCTRVLTCREWYEPQSMMLSEDAVVVCGLLMGLNALDYNVMMSGEDFDKSVSPCRHEA